MSAAPEYCSVKHVVIQKSESEKSFDSFLQKRMKKSERKYLNRQMSRRIL